MSEENHDINAERDEEDGHGLEAEAQHLPSMRSDRAESGMIINIDQVQSVDISDRFTKDKTEHGWAITLHSKTKVIINLTTSMRKIEHVLIAGDVIERDATDLIIFRKHPPDAYRTQKSSSPLARSREALLQSNATNETPV